MFGTFLAIHCVCLLSSLQCDVYTMTYVVLFMQCAASSIFSTECHMVLMQFVDNDSVVGCDRQNRKYCLSV